MKNILAKELGKSNIRLSTRLWGILTTHEFDMGDVDFVDPETGMIHTAGDPKARRHAAALVNSSP